MKITNEAKPLIEELLKEKGAEGLIMEVHESCCGKSPVFALVTYDPEDQPELVNGIKVLIFDQDKEAAKDIEIDVVDNELVVKGADSCGCSHEGDHACGGCGDHAHHEHGEGCCGSHDHEGGCCHHHEE